MATKKSNAAATGKQPVQDNPAIAEVFADDFVGLYGIGPNFHLTFAARRPADTGKPDLTRVVAARLVLPIDAMLDMYTALQAAVGKLESTGVIKAKGKG